MIRIRKIDYWRIGLFRAFANTERFNTRMKRTQRNKLVEAKGREYRGLLALGSLLLLIGVHLYLLSRLIFFPYPEFFIYSYLTKQGLLPYKQIFDQHFPGLMFFPLNFATLGVNTPAVARFWHFGVVAVTHGLLFLLARKVLKSEKFALLANFLYLVWQPFFEGYVFWIDLFVPLLALSALFFLIKSDRFEAKSLFLSGFFLGAALLFKQVMVLTIILVFVYVLFLAKKKVIWFIFGVAIPAGLLAFYITAIGVWQDFIYWCFTFNLTTFARMGRKYPDLTSLVKVIPLFGLALFSWLYSVVKVRTKIIVWLGIFLLGSLAFAYARFDFIHLQPALPLAILTIVVILRKIPRTYIVLTLPFYFLATVYLLNPFYRANLGNRVLFFGQFERQVMQKVTQYARPGETTFAMGTTPHLYQMTKTLPPGRVFVIQFPWFMTVAEDRILSGIIKDPPKVVVRNKTATTGGVRLIAYMGKINQYLEENYKVVDRVEDTEIMIKK